VDFNADLRNGTVRLNIPAPIRLQDTAKDMPTSSIIVSEALWRHERLGLPLFINGNTSALYVNGTGPRPGA
jgi:hypothetical protein